MAGSRWRDLTNTGWERRVSASGGPRGGAKNRTLQAAAANNADCRPSPRFVPL